jgi:chromate transporter
VVIHVGHTRAGWRGLIVAGTVFILPAALIVLALAWLYVEYGTTPVAEWMLYGVKPVIIVVILQALWGLGKAAIKGRLLAAVGLLVLILYLLGIDELLLLFAAGLLVMLIRNVGRTSEPPPLAALAALPALCFKHQP